MVMRKRPVYIIAEVGVNHNGSAALAAELVDAAAAAGADAVKFQMFDAASLTTADAPAAAYQQHNAPGIQSQHALLGELGLSAAQFRSLHAQCRQIGIDFLASPFNYTSVAQLAGEFAAAAMKIASGEATNLPLLVRIAQTGCKAILSTGMCTLADIEHALSALAYGYLHRAGPGTQPTPSLAQLQDAYFSAEGQQQLAERVSLLHAITAYPASPEMANLYVMDTLMHAFGLPVGLSDHSRGTAIAIAAAARGATIIEKHLTLNRQLPGVDQEASLEPAEFRSMVAGIRDVEAALGSPAVIPGFEERIHAPLVRRSLVAARPIAAGEAFTAGNLALKRPGTGLPPAYYWELLGKTAQRNYRKDEQIE